MPATLVRILDSYVVTRMNGDISQNGILENDTAL